MLVAAGYNAGPTRPRRWVVDYGDPRDPEVDPVDWIETIPFDETRNYIMRVTESIPVYRARLQGKVEPITLLADLKAR
jgi:soluble lytic murein transglycosylase